jgi:phospholipase/carboxylesterase
MYLAHQTLTNLRSLTRRRFLTVAGTLVAAELTGLRQLTTASAAMSEQGRLKIPTGSPAGASSAGLQRLGGTNGLLYIPSSRRGNEPLPLLILLHKSGGSPSNWFSGGHPEQRDSYSAYAEEGRFAILAPQASGPTWGVGPKTFGGDYATINSAIEMAFGRCAIDRNRLAIGGFSDGASYALSLGLANGDLFGNVIAFSPGYIVRSIGRGKPAVFIAHGLLDNILPIDVCSRPFVRSLRKNGYSVDFHEFSGGHQLLPAIADQAMAWLMAGFQRRH